MPALESLHPPARALTQADLLHLACPVCHSSLILHEIPEAGSPSASPAQQTILCSSCARIYPIVDNLPILLADRSSSPQ